MTPPKNHFGAILIDPPWPFATWSARGRNRSADNHYPLMTLEDIAALDVGQFARDDCALFVWVTWPSLPQALMVIEAWRFKYKTCAFCWTKADASQIDMLRDDLTPAMGLGYWTRSNSEVCLLATRGKPKRLHADVRQAIIEPAREHSRKPRIHQRIERLVTGPYLEMFARQLQAGWSVLGNEVGKFTSDMEAAE
jgi:N6-adenosine-specific RNA methylase IME4